MNECGAHTLVDILSIQFLGLSRQLFLAQVHTCIYLCTYTQAYEAYVTHSCCTIFSRHFLAYTHTHEHKCIYVYNMYVYIYLPHSCGNIFSKRLPWLLVAFFQLQFIHVRLGALDFLQVCICETIVYQLQFIHLFLSVLDIIYIYIYIYIYRHTKPLVRIIFLDQ
jgi:hypothetical protein